MSLLDVHGLKVDFVMRQGMVTPVDGIDLTIDRGERLAIVGESGAGKSLAMLAVMGLVDAPGRVQAGHVLFRGRDLLRARPAQRRAVLGKEIGMIFQDPVSSLNPCHTIGHQLDEVLRRHTGMHRAGRRQRSLELLQAVGMTDPERAFQAWPHQLSGGMNQRAMIAIAIACRPALLIADEPTTALDATIQVQIMRLLDDLTTQHNMAMILVSHDLATVSGAVDRVMVMYAGQVVESAARDALFRWPLHPYTQALLASMPAGRLARGRRLPVIPGRVPAISDLPVGCRFHPRCLYADGQCRSTTPPLEQRGHDRWLRCFHPCQEKTA